VLAFKLKLFPTFAAIIYIFILPFDSLLLCSLTWPLTLLFSVSAGVDCGGSRGRLSSGAAKGEGFKDGWEAGGEGVCTLGAIFCARRCANWRPVPLRSGSSRG
jgi:hypothetical protein